MGLNNYKFYDKEEVDQFTTLINRERETIAQRKLREATGALPDTMSPMEGAENQHIKFMEVESGEGHLLTMLTRDLGRQYDRPMKALDIGTFTGHSAGCIARGMENGGTVITCDISDKYKAIAEQYWKDEGVSDRIDYRIVSVDANGKGGANKVLEELVSNPQEQETFDIVFIDADKMGYEKYYKQALKLLRPGGKILLDNMLWSGRVADPDAQDPTTNALRQLNKDIITDKGVDAVLLNADDGIMVVEKLGFAGRKDLKPKPIQIAHAAPGLQVS